MLRRSTVMAIREKIFFNTFVVHSRHMLVEDTTHQHYLGTTDLPVKSLGFNQFWKWCHWLATGWLYFKQKTGPCSTVTSGLGATSQGKILVPHAKHLRPAFALLCTLAVLLDVRFLSYFLGTQGEIWPWTKSWNKDYVTMMIKWDFCINVNFILCGFLPRGKSDPQA